MHDNQVFIDAPISSILAQAAEPERAYLVSPTGSRILTRTRQRGRTGTA